MNGIQQSALCLYAITLTLWVIAERWRLARLTDSPWFSLVGVLFTLCFALQVVCASLSAAVVLSWV